VAKYIWHGSLVKEVGRGLESHPLCSLCCRIWSLDS